MAEAKFSRKHLRESLEAQLAAQNANVAHFQELIDAFLYFYGEEKKMRADVKKNGHMIEAVSATGVPMMKENPAVKNAAMYNKQRLQILKEMGITTASVKIITGDDGDL